MKPLQENLLDAMNLRRHVRGRQADDVAGLARIEALQVEQKNLPIQRPQLLRQFLQPRNGALFIESAVVCGTRV